RQTSGLMVIATHHRAHAELSTAFESGRVSKTYLAIVEGSLTPAEGTINLPIGRDRADRRVLMSARADAVDARPARTQFRVEERFEAHTVVLAKPFTGRNHQIRVHFAHIGHPLLGDEFYDRHGVLKPWRDSTPAAPPLPPGLEDESSQDFKRRNVLRPLTLLKPGRHALHAASLSFAHPITGAWMAFHAPLPTDLQRVIESLERDQSLSQVNEV
ncbi:MAG: RluA family pseudouridine synthase, partial [Planctomycetaceae bacterium]|nr:RluA family pseudouridine synthase [Planctomycetaceae bacterium]